MTAIGERIPACGLWTMTEQGPQVVQTDELTAGKRIVLFAVPGAFTPTCSDEHLPGFQVRAPEILERGVDLIVCMAVNDVFVMGAWGKARQIADDILLLADGNGELTRALGLELDGSRFGMGTRSKRFAAILDDGVFTTLNVEPPGGGVDASSAEAILGLL